MAAPLLLDRGNLANSGKVTPDEFMSLAVERAELVDGVVVEKMPPFFDHGNYAAAIVAALFPYVVQHKLGKVTLDGAFLTQESRIRAPDVAFLSTEDLAGQNTAGLIRVPPTLAIEVISPNDTYLEVEDKALEYLAAGTRAVWIVNPRRRTVTVRSAAGGETTYGVGQSVPGGEILPGFELRVANIFDS